MTSGAMPRNWISGWQPDSRLVMRTLPEARTGSRTVRWKSPSRDSSPTQDLCPAMLSDRNLASQGVVQAVDATDEIGNGFAAFGPQQVLWNSELGADVLNRARRHCPDHIGVCGRNRHDFVLDTFRHHLEVRGSRAYDPRDGRAKGLKLFRRQDDPMSFLVLILLATLSASVVPVAGDPLGRDTS